MLILFNRSNELTQNMHFFLRIFSSLAKQDFQGHFLSLSLSACIFLCKMNLYGNIKASTVALLHKFVGCVFAWMFKWNRNFTQIFRNSLKKIINSRNFYESSWRHSIMRSRQMWVYQVLDCNFPFEILHDYGSTRTNHLKWSAFCWLLLLLLLNFHWRGHSLGLFFSSSSHSKTGSINKRNA